MSELLDVDGVICGPQEFTAGDSWHNLAQSLGVENLRLDDYLKKCFPGLKDANRFVIGEAFKRVQELEC